LHDLADGKNYYDPNSRGSDEEDSEYTKDSEYTPIPTRKLAPISVSRKKKVMPVGKPMSSIV
jgi:hypothetical protein